VDTSANNGAGNLQVSVESSNSTFSLQLCPFPQTQNLSNCINVTTFTSDAHNFANVNFTFPSKGTFAGIFAIIDSAGNLTEVASAGSTGMSYRSALLPAATITGGIGQTTGNSPGIGSVVVNGTTAHVTLTGAFPSHTFTIARCPTCAPLGNITTDAQGNGSADGSALLPGNMFEGDPMFFVSDASGVQFVTAFRVQ
jgi:hypothetical protein